MGIKEFYGKGNNLDYAKCVYAVDWSFCKEDTHILPPRRSDLAINPFLLKVFHFNDLHSNIYTFTEDYSMTPVFSKIVHEVDKERATSNNRIDTGVIFLSAGDDSIGSPLDYFTGYNGENFISHPAYSAYSMGGIDATVLGNHDFDTGLKTLKKSIRQDTNFPVLSANLMHEGELNDLVYPGAIIAIKGVRIGIIGLTTPGQIRSREGSIFSISNPLKTIEKFYYKLAPYCDSIIILSHLGYRLGSTFAAVKLMGDMELAAGLDDKKIDSIIGGHTHDFLNINGLELKNIVNNIPVLQAGFNGLFYGKTVLKISKQNTLIYTAVLPTGNLTSSKDFDSAYENSVIGKNIAILKKPLGNVNIEDEYRTEKYDIFFKNSFENPMANYITDSINHILRQKSYSVDITLIDGTSMMEFFNPKNESVNIIDIYRLMPYADTIVLSSVTSEELREIVQENLQRINKDNQPNIERGFLHFSKMVRYTLDITKSEVTDILINGTPLDSCKNDFFTLAMPNYVQGLSKSWEESEAANGHPLRGLHDFEKEDTGMYLRDELLKYIKRKGVSKESGFLLDGRLKIK